MDLSTIGRALLVVAAVAAGLGVVLLVAGALGLGRLPGDISLGKGNVRFYFPVATCLVLDEHAPGGPP
ncbi:MAG TPA: DUF2905 domain-containing protein, partial [Acidimicrobiales bacterium]|nr:DUF2905 domain-containing protein [Acidimicrobiales bacterium]